MTGTGTIRFRNYSCSAALGFALLALLVPAVSRATPADTLSKLRSTVSAPRDGSHVDDGCSCAMTVLKGLNFGAMFTSASPGTIVISPSSNATYTGGVYAHMGLANYAPCAAEVELNLENPLHCENDDHSSTDNNEYERNEDDDDRTCDTREDFTRHGLTCDFTISNSSTLRRSGGTETMTADSYTHSRTKGDITIGATLHVNANQVSGNYSGTFYVTLNYQ